jgi:membrane protein DedA with SNARE-associated domain
LLSDATGYFWAKRKNLFMTDFLQEVIDLVSSVDPFWRGVFSGLFIMLETSLFVGLVIPGDTIVLVASTGVTSWPDFFWLLAAVLIGSMIGETIGFSIGRFFGPRLRASRLGQRIGDKNWELADRLVKRRGGFAIFVSRFMPVLHSIVPAVAGMTKMPYRTFILWTFLACALWTSMYVGVGFLARASYEQLSDNLRIAVLVGIGILVVFLVLISVGKKLLNRISNQ